MDIFLEYIVARKKNLKDIAIIAGILLGLCLLLFISLFFMFTQLSSFVMLLDAGLIYLAYLGITSRNVEYEYIVTNGEVDIDKITHRRKRKRIISVHSKTFDMVAPVGESAYRGEEHSTVSRVIDVASSPTSERAYFALFSKDGQRIKLIFEPTERMLDAFTTFVPRNVHKRSEQ
ncbi:MAG: hypothetical protein E7409_02140 [Ruminococcaceae bacterium]|nr:hypothetical protein [Oscillospiraceae bacterium]